ncbi:hypothetical protein [Mycoplasmopsis verecunda]|uniref:Uncharacterized protein n=1 Tax=Mycoplasmopsis verecunda TaxID=171291 RepID=A0A1T4LD83_9BACT|nr:hypothetical protein [Mycoplasmopsis verecunda]WPB54316.1 hypothetical protein SAM46_02390 [Mycoplasmopsis verecunda]SJZ52640.1 hypothetical protein SAMN02745154_00411 [Mycoplasmopsis verecunda]
MAVIQTPYNEMHRSAITVIWIGFALSFFLGIIDNIIAMVGLAKAKRASQEVYSE